MGDGPTSGDDRRYAGEDLIDWAVRTDRLKAGTEAEACRRRLNEERNRAIAAAGPGRSVQPGLIEQTLQILTPLPGVNAGHRVDAMAAPVSPPVDEFAALFPPRTQADYERKWAADPHPRRPDVRG